MLGISPTAYDLRFRMFGIPIRVHPMFWLATAILASQQMKLPALLLWIGCVFISILVHELGHGLLAERYSNCREIVLYTLGGLCFYSPEPRRPSQQLAIVLAGPGAGFLLCLAFLIAASLTWGITPREHLSMVSNTVGVDSLTSALGMEPLTSRDDLLSGTRKLINLRSVQERRLLWAYELYDNIVFINLMWGLVNLLPILPLDGGRATSILLSLYDRSQAQRWTYIASLLTSGILAVYGMSRPEPNYFLIILFGSLAFMNYQSLQAIHQTQIFSSGDEDWWRR